MELLVEGFNLGAQGADGSVAHRVLAVEPLAQGTGSGVHAAGEFRAGVEGVAEVGGPLVVGHLGLHGPIQQIGGLLGGILRILNT